MATCTLKNWKLIHSWPNWLKREENNSMSFMNFFKKYRRYRSYHLSRNNGIICPIHNKGNVIMCDKYRAVTLLCTIYKILAYILYKISTLRFGNNRRIPRRLLKGKITCWSNFYYETNTGIMWGTKYRCTSSIYWFSSSIWHYGERKYGVQS